MSTRFTALLALSLVALAGKAQPIDWHDPSAVAQAAANAHPSLRRIEADARGAKERVTTAASYPNPMLMGGIQDLQVDLSHDPMMTMYMVGASQTIPRRSRRNALRSAAELDVRKIELEAASIRAEAERDAIFSWYDIAASDSQNRTLQEVGKALDTLVAAVRARYESGNAIQADIIRAQLQRSEVDHQILAITGIRRAAAARLLALLGLPLTIDIPQLHVSHATEKVSISDAREIPDSHPALMALRTEVDRREEEIRLAKLLGRPDIHVEASYGLRPQETDMVSLVARMELPLRRKTTIEPRVREAIALRDAASARIEETRRALVADLGVAWEAHAEATGQIEFHEQTLVPQSKLAFESTRAAYEGGKTTLDAVLASQAAYLRLGTDYYGFLAQHIKAVTDFNAIKRGARAGAIAGSAAMSSQRAAAPMPSAAPEMR